MGQARCLDSESVPMSTVSSRNGMPWRKSGTTLLAHYYIPKAAAQKGMDFVMQEDGAPSHSSAMTRIWRSDAANWPPTATLFTPGFPANSPDLNPVDYHVWAAWQHEVNKVLKERFAGHAKNEMEMKAAVCTAWTQVDQNAVKRSFASWPRRLLLCIEKEGGCFEYARVKRALKTEVFTAVAPVTPKRASHSEHGNTSNTSWCLSVCPHCSHITRTHTTKHSVTTSHAGLLPS